MVGFLYKGQILGREMGHGVAWEECIMYMYMYM